MLLHNLQLPFITSNLLMYNLQFPHGCHCHYGLMVVIFIIVAMIIMVAMVMEVIVVMLVRQTGQTGQTGQT